MYSCKMVKDSVTWDGRFRLSTLEVTFPRIVLAEFNTHRVFSRNSASSRAIPVAKMLARVTEDPFLPVYWGKNQKGMQAEEELSDAQKLAAERRWLEARDAAVQAAKDLAEIGVHKQIMNRLIEPFLWQTCLVSSTEWSNWDALRDHKDAQPEIRVSAQMLKEERDKSTPRTLGGHQWHLPFVDQDEIDHTIAMRKVSSGRACRISYLTHDGLRNMEADVDTHDKLLSSGHMSPLEHVARPMSEYERELFRRPGWEWNEEEERWAATGEQTFFLGNFQGFLQHRKLIKNEHDFGLVKKS